MQLREVSMDEDVFSDTLDENYIRSTQVALSRPRLDSRMSVCVPTKGLLNAPGENNCFLNVSVQVWSTFFQNDCLDKSVNCKVARKFTKKIMYAGVLFKFMPGHSYIHKFMRSYFENKLFSCFGLSFFMKKSWKLQLKVTTAKKMITFKNIVFK